MGHYRSALGNWLRGRRRQREASKTSSDGASGGGGGGGAPAAAVADARTLAPTLTRGRVGDSAASLAPMRALGESAHAVAPEDASAARGRRSVSDSAMLEAPHHSMRHMRSFQAVDAASHLGGRQREPLARAAAPSTSQHRRSTWVSRQEAAVPATSAAAPTPVFAREQQPEAHASLRRFHLSRRLSRPWSRPHASREASASGLSPDTAVALTPGPSIIFIEC